ncbi:MAG: hypothetical protein ACYC69_16490 [Thermodesulfovibrionales bacterium]
MKKRIQKIEDERKGRIWEVKLRLTDLEYAYIRMAARLEGMKPMEYTRNVAVTYAEALYKENREAATYAMRQNLDESLKRYNAAVRDSKTKKVKVPKSMPPECHVGDKFSY